MIPLVDIESVEIGRIRKSVLGVRVPILWNSRGAYLCNFLVVNFRDKNGEKNTVVYPHLNNVSDWHNLVRLLSNVLGSKLLLA